jgi:hypothetical protein
LENSTDSTVGTLVGWRYHLFPMTMQIRGVQTTGLPVKTVREMLRRLNIYSLMGALFVATRCKVSTRKAKEVIKTLADGGYIEADTLSLITEAENCLTATGRA